MTGSWRCPTCRLDVPDGELRCPRDGTPLVVDPVQLRDPLIGAQLGEYRIQERIGSGGMGFVYRALQPLIAKQVAVKVLRPEIAEDPEQMQRLLSEARAVTAIRHRGIIDVFGFGQVPDGRHYLVMEFLEGVTIEHLLETGQRLAVPDVVSLLDEILSALAAAHSAGVIHRDLKPSNLFLAAQSDGTSVVKVVDFGLAKRASPGKSSPQTRASLMVGTPQYMAPEQARGEPVGPTTDLYSLGVVAYQLLSGTLPFTGENPIEIVLQHLDKAPPPLSRVAPNVPVGLQTLVLSLMAKSPKDRPQRADDVRHSLRQLGIAGVTLPPVSPSGATALRPQALRSLPSVPGAVHATPSGMAETFLRKRPPRVTAALVGTVLVLGGAAVVWAVGGRTPPPASPAVVPLPPPVEPAPAPNEDRTAEWKGAGQRTEPPPPETPKASAPEEKPAIPAAKPPEPIPAAAPVRTVHVSKNTSPVRKPVAHPYAVNEFPAAPSQAELSARIEQMTARLRASAGSGDPDPLALALLQKAKSDAQRAPDAPGRDRINHRLDVIESKFLSP